MSSPRYARITESDDSQRYLVDLFDSNRRFSINETADIDTGSIVYYHVDDNATQNVIIESLIAKPDSAASAIWLALSEYGLDPEFSDRQQRETESILQTHSTGDSNLTDLTDLPFVTIDNVDSKDLDQAMHLSAESGAGYTLHYALADAAHYIKPGSALFKRALERGASYYVPNFSVPMLPRELSEGLVSLNEGKLRRALVFKIEFDQHGAVTDTSVTQSTIVSVAKLSYQGVEDYYMDPKSSALNDQPYTHTLDMLRVLGKLRVKISRQRNVVEYDRSGVEIELDNDGQCFTITPSERLNVERYNEQISLICNAEGARLLEAAGLSSVVQAIYRVHDAPDEERLKKFSRLLRGLIKQHHLSPQQWIWRWRDGKYGKRETLASYLERLRSDQVELGLLSAVQRHALMLSPASRFSAEAGVHHSLKLDQYARFSSPMREIAGIYTHREFLQYQAITGSKSKTAMARDIYDDEVLRIQVIEAANRSKEVQKKLNKLVLKKAIDQLFQPELLTPVASRKVWSGTVISLRTTRVYVRLDDPEIVVKIYLRELSRLTGIAYKLDKSSAFITNKVTRDVVFILGEQLSLKTFGYSDDELRWWLIPSSVAAVLVTS